MKLTQYRKTRIRVSHKTPTVSALFNRRFQYSLSFISASMSPKSGNLAPKALFSCFRSSVSLADRDIARPAGPVALRSLPAKAYRKKAFRRFSLSCAALIQGPNVGCATYSSPKVFCLANRSPSYPTAVIRCASSPPSCISAPSTLSFFFHFGTFHPIT
jgi:hypothetical protein